MRRSFLAVPLLAAAACVDVPDAIHAQFAAAGPTDRSNFRPGNHGSAPPVESPAPKAAGSLAAPLEARDDAGPPPPADTAVDGGTS
ncbi:MAG TPA: hypothetical protein VM925_02190 [Labilithrix sp.]|jgi:hypothetical protein|nr:hypothetical protein [Labilithrix sp.]